VATVEAVGPVRVRTHGGSRPRVMRLADGRHALVKLRDNPQTTRALVGELIGTLLGRAVGAAVPEPLLVALADEGAPRGLHFGTVYHPEAGIVSTPRQAAGLANLDRLPVTALAEAWLYNTDLKRDHVLAVRTARGRELLVVDHGHVFPGGPAWTPDRMDACRDQAPDPMALTRVARLAGGGFDFGRALEACASVCDADLEAMVAAVPGEWGLGTREAESVHRFLAGRRHHLARWADRLARAWQDGGRR
jgi:hypothetical protein